MKRAEENRKLGVKKLKLPPVTKPKIIKYCHQFVKGRCHEVLSLAIKLFWRYSLDKENLIGSPISSCIDSEILITSFVFPQGDKCKFSHDTVPLTKSEVRFCYYMRLTICLSPFRRCCCCFSFNMVIAIIIQC